MARLLLPVVALLAAVFAGCVAGQSGIVPTSQLYLDSLRTGGLPFRPGTGFYTPEGATYTVDYYGQCGGTGAFCNPASGQCADRQYTGATCPVGFTCSRNDATYWQCMPATATYTMAPAGITPLAAYQQCGGQIPANSSFVGDGVGPFVNTSCPDGYLCTSPSSSTNYSLCTPNPLTVPTQQDVILQTANQIAGIVGDATGAQALAPGLLEYNFQLPALDAKHAGGPASAILNITKIVEIGEALFNKTAPGPSPPPSPPSPASPPPGFPSPPPPPPPVSPPPPPPPVSPYTVPRINFSPPSPLTISGTNLVNSTGGITALKGFNWFGFNVGQTMVDGLYQNFLNPRNFSQVGDFATIVYRQQLLGFNTVRLPFRFADLNLPPKDFTRACSADSQAQIIGNLSNPTVPYYQIPYNTLTVPPQTAPILPPQDVASSGLCNSYLPSDSTLNRFLYVIQFYVGNGFYVAIDYHAEGSNTVDQATVSDPATFQANWLRLVGAIQSLPTYNQFLKGRIFLDLMNEPDGFNFAWSQSNPLAPNGDLNNIVPGLTVQPWGTLFTTTAAAIVNIAPDFLFFAEGTGQKNQPGSAFGMGFGIDTTLFDNRPGFYNALLGLQTLAGNTAVKSRTLITPHCYGQQVTGWSIGNTNNNAGQPLPFTYYTNFAYLNIQGVPLPGGGAATFPIAIGEFGNTFNSSFNATLDAFSDPLTDQWIHDFAQYSNLLDPGFAAQYPHYIFVNNIWWDWNANSFPQLGLVNADPGDVTSIAPNSPLNPGWLNIQWVKINNLTDVLFNNPLFTPAQAVATGGGWGLRPFYLPPTTHTPF